jgi:hypothetical protein
MPATEWSKPARRMCDLEITSSSGLIETPCDSPPVHEPCHSPVHSRPPVIGLRTRWISSESRNDGSSLTPARGSSRGSVCWGSSLTTL